HVTTVPVGRWVIRTAESVVLTPWPPLPDDRYTSILRSDSSISTGPTSSGSGKTSTPAADVCTRPWDSVTGTRCTRWTPPSNFSRDHTPSLDGCRARMDSDASLTPPRSDSVAPSIWTTHPCFSAYRVYIRASSEA